MSFSSALCQPDFHRDGTARELSILHNLLNIRNPALVFVMLVALSLPPRLVSLQAPFVGEDEFRQTQTALSVWEIREHVTGTILTPWRGWKSAVWIKFGTALFFSNRN